MVRRSFLGQLTSAVAQVLANVVRTWCTQVLANCCDSFDSSTRNTNCSGGEHSVMTSCSRRTILRWMLRLWSIPMLAMTCGLELAGAQPGLDGPPEYVRALELQFGAPSQKAFGSAVFFDNSTSAEELEDMARSKYRYFVEACGTSGAKTLGWAPGGRSLEEEALMASWPTCMP